MRKVPQLKLHIYSKHSDSTTIDIDGEIGGVGYDGEDYTFNTTEAVKRKLREISDISASVIEVNINSPGGFVNDGLAIHDALAQHSAKIITNVYGMTASAATIIAQAGDQRRMSENALYLIHRAWGMALGNQNDMREMIGTLDKIDNRIAGLYARRGGRDDSFFLDLMNENEGSGRFLDSTEAEEFALIDSTFEPMKAAACVDKAVLNAMELSLPKDHHLHISNVSKRERRRAKQKLMLR
jgi:ATP-dependent protease ClpP protease subunit